MQRFYVLKTIDELQYPGPDLYKITEELVKVDNQFKEADVKNRGIFIVKKNIKPNTIYRRLLRPMVKDGLLSVRREVGLKRKNRYSLTEKGRKEYMASKVRGVNAAMDVRIIFSSDYCSTKLLLKETEMEELIQDIVGIFQTGKKELELIKEYAVENPDFVVRLRALADFYYLYQIFIKSEDDDFSEMLTKLAKTNEIIKKVIMQ